MTKTAIQWAMVFFKLLASTGAGILGFVGLVELMGTRTETSRKAIIVSLVLLVAAGCAALLQVGKPAGIMQVVGNLSVESPISWELVSFGVAVIVGIVYLLLSNSKNALIKLVAVIAIIMAIAVGFTSGYSHMSMLGMRSWHNAAIPASFLFSAILLGGLGYLAVAGKSEDEKGFSLVTTIVIVLAVLTTLGYCAFGVTAELGDYMLAYWALAPVIGGAACAASSFLIRVKDSLVWVYTSLATALVGAIAFRALIWSIVVTGLSSGSHLTHP